MDLEGSTLELEAPSARIESEAKRRKLRKGTTSCWECKRRKIRCSLALDNDGPCDSCRRRGTACINQEIREGELTSTIKNPMLRVEALINELAKKVSGGTENGRSQPKPGIATPESSNNDDESERSLTVPEDSEDRPTIDDGNYEVVNRPSWLPTCADTTSQGSPPVPTLPRDVSKYAELSKTLYAAFPSQKDADILCGACNSIALSFYQVNTRPHSKLEKEGLKMGGNVGQPHFYPTPITHPVILGRQMLIFASLIQQANVKQLSGLSQDPQTIMKTLADIAIRLVSTNEELLGTTEGLECVILEGVYQWNCGNLRRAWLAFRRALMLGQFMGINRPHCPPLHNLDPSTKINPQFMWFRIVYLDRFLSMMLGLPQGTTDISMGSDTAMAGDTPMGKLERTHAVIACRILERKDRDPVFRDLTVTKELDEELLKVAKSMPAKFWLSPDFSNFGKDTKHDFWETLRLVDQLLHYNMVIQLHLPFLLRPGSQYEYSKMACVNASRDILIRFTTYAEGHWNCFGFFAVPASMTLLLAHLDGHRHHEADNFLAHQRLSDHAMIEKVLETMEKHGKETNDEESSKKSENILQCLLSIEAEAAEGQCYTARSVQGIDEFQEDSNTVRISVPYFGVIKITRDGVISKEASQPRSTPEQDEECFDETGGTGSVHACNQIFTFNQPSASTSLSQIGFNSVNDPQVPRQAQTLSSGQEPLGFAQFQHTTHNFDVQNQHLFPGLTAGIEDWTFQGVDNAFFDNLMMGTDALDGGSSLMPDWQNENPRGT